MDDLVEILEELEPLVFLASVVFAIIGMVASSTLRLHRLHYRDNPAPGIVRLGTLLAMGWIYYVLMYHADPSVTDVYVIFYLVLGYATVKFGGQGMAWMYGFRTRVDAGERRNVPMAIVIASFTLATGLIFGGSLWGEADPVGDDEGGWWIPVTFAFLGWVVLRTAFRLFRQREGQLALRLRHDRSLADARAAAAFLLSSAVILTDAVAGDFWGWWHALFSFGLLALLLLVHESFTAWTKLSAAQSGAGALDTRRVVESLAYLVLAVLAWGASRYIDSTWIPA